MSVNIQSSLDVLKRQALFTIAGNLKINKTYLKEQINQYIANGNSLFSSLLNRFPFREDVISSCQINSVYLLAYLDFYALYTILYANYGMFNNLYNVSMQKYAYINSLYKDLISMIKDKRLAAVNTNSMYINFLNPKNLNASESNSRANNNPAALNTDLLTLPIKSSKVIKPSSVIISDDDKSIHYTTNNSSLDVVDYTIERLQNPMIGLVSRVYAGSPTTQYAIGPVINGTIYEFFSDRIFVQCTEIERDNNDKIISISLKSSSNGQLWSGEYKASPGVPANIIIEGDIDTGLTILLYDIHPTLGYTLGLSVNDIWNIDIANVVIPDPKIKVSTRFESLDYISYARFSDLSVYELSEITASYKKKKYTELNLVDTSICFHSSLDNIIPIFDQVGELCITAEHKDYDISQVGTDLTYAYKFKMSDISLFSNEYEQQGSITFEEKNVKNVSAISVETNEYILNKGNYSGQNAQKMFIEHSIVIKNDDNDITLPILPIKEDTTIYEFIIPTYTESNIAFFKTRFPAKTNLGTFRVVDLFDGSTAGSEYDSLRKEFKITSYLPHHSYAIEYEMICSNFQDIGSVTSKWNYNPDIRKPIYYTYNRDTFGNNSIMLRQDDGTGKKLLFSGKIKSFIEMRSVEKPYITPIVYEYEILSS